MGRHYHQAVLDRAARTSSTNTIDLGDVNRRFEAEDGSARLLAAMLAYYRKHHHPTVESLG